MKIDVNKYIAEHSISTKKAPFRQSYHVMAPVGLINDPNGFCEYKGRYYLFYQIHPFKAYHGLKYWAQIVSDDLVNWEYQGIVLEPEFWFEKDGCFSGNIMVIDDIMYLYYTGNIWKGGVEFDVGEEYQCLAISCDGKSFKKLSKPIINHPDFTQYTPHHRDPKVWKHNNRYYMIVGAQTKEEKPEIIMYHSLNLTDWEYKSVLLDSAGGEHSKAYMWECPNYCEIGHKDVLFICPQGMTYEEDLTKNIHQSGYLIGDIDYDRGKFLYDEKSYKLLDYGFEFYAPQIYTDRRGRHLCIGWMGLPNEDDHPSVEYGWIHCLTLPTELVMKGDKLYRKPVKELETLRKKEIVVDESTSYSFSKACFELIIEFEANSDIAVNLRCSNNMEYCTKLFYNSKRRKMILDRNNNRFNFQGKREVKISKHTQKLRLDIFVDHSSIEIFINDGEYVLTTRIFTLAEDILNTIDITDDKSISYLKVWGID